MSAKTVVRTSWLSLVVLVAILLGVAAGTVAVTWPLA